MWPFSIEVTIVCAAPKVNCVSAVGKTTKVSVLGAFSELLTVIDAAELLALYAPAINTVEFIPTAGNGDVP